VISIVNKRNYDGPGEYVGRPSPLGNPFPLGPYTREDSIAHYESFLEYHRHHDGPIKNELNRLANMSLAGDLTLICWCAPLPCHADVIKRKIEEILT
jgi:hypothetical protein